MALVEGRYKITSKLTDTIVGRALAEDRSLLPKKVLVGGSIRINDTPWGIQPVEGKNKYTLRAVGAVVVKLNGKVYADLLGDLPQKDWVLNPQFHQGENLYTITVPGDEFLGWVVPDADKGPQVQVGVLTATKSLPPLFAAKGLFEIVPVTEDY